MVAAAAESEATPQAEVNSPMQTGAENNYRQQQNPKNGADNGSTSSNGGAANNNDNPSANGVGGVHYPYPPLGRQSSIYSLTLDEFQHTLCENGKDFGSMNMDEFLNSIWTAEEHQQNRNQNGGTTNTATTTAAMMMNGQNGTGSSILVNAGQVMEGSNTTPATGSQIRGIKKQPSLPRQGSLTLPPPLCRKTVDEVWSEIQRTQPGHPLRDHMNGGGGGSSGGENGARRGDSASAQRQQTFGEMTLEDFLIKAGVVREQDPVTSMVLPSGVLPPPPPPQQPPTAGQYGLYPPGATNTQQLDGHSFTTRPMMGMPAAASVYPTGDPSIYSGGAAGANKRANGYAAVGGPPQAPPPPASMCYGGGAVTVAGGGGGYGGGTAAGLGMASPVSPLGPDVLCGPGPVDGQTSQYGGMDVNAALRGRKRTLDGPVEKVVERRRRRMIKNRESAARSRARKQAYTVELEAELNQLREENAQLKQALAEIQRQSQNEPQVLDDDT